MMKKHILILLIALFSVACEQTLSHVPSASKTTAPSANTQTETTQNEKIVQAFKQHKSYVQVEGKGEVVKLLSDDNMGSRHQKFLVRISSEQTLLFAHNLDLAPRVEPLAVGDTLEFKGEYVYNPKGGLIHWTHKDPHGHRASGWIKRNGKVYE